MSFVRDLSAIRCDKYGDATVAIGSRNAPNCAGFAERNDPHVRNGPRHPRKDGGSRYSGSPGRAAEARRRLNLSTHGTMGSGSRRVAASFAALVTASRDVAVSLTPTVMCALMT